MQKLTSFLYPIAFIKVGLYNILWLTMTNFKMRFLFYFIQEKGKYMYLEVKDLKKSYGVGEGHTEVLKGITTSIEQGIMCVIQGPSGSGKSTFLNCIGGLELPDSGSIAVDGNEIVGLNPMQLSDFRRDYLGYII